MKIIGKFKEQKAVNAETMEKNTPYIAYPRGNSEEFNLNSIFIKLSNSDILVFDEKVKNYFPFGNAYDIKYRHIQTLSFMKIDTPIQITLNYNPNKE